jgi:hypothetical protein
MALPPNLATNDVISEAWVDAVVDELTALPSRYVPLAGGVLLTDTAQTIPTGVTTDITWGTEVSDPDGWTSGGSATLTVPAGKGGRYVITFSGQWAVAVSTGAVALNINGGATFYESTFAGATFYMPTLTVLRTLVAGDTFKISISQSMGGNRDIASRLEIAPV